MNATLGPAFFRVEGARLPWWVGPALPHSEGSVAGALWRLAPSEVAHDQRDDGHEVDLADEHLEDADRVPEVAARGEVPIADRRERGEAEVQAVGDGGRDAAGEERLAAQTVDRAEHEREQQPEH